MRKGKRWLSAIVMVTALALVAAACGGDDGDSGDGGGNEPSGLVGSIDISGSSTVEPISSLVAELFNGSNPDVEISVAGPGTGDGFTLFCQGDIDIADASRPIDDQDEAPVCANAGIQYQELEIALDGITVMVNSASSIECLTTADLYAIFGPESDGVASTTDANSLSRQVGGAGDMPVQDLEITAPGEESGTYDAFIELSGIPDFAESQGVPESDRESLRADYTSSANDNVIIQAMEGSPNAIGFAGFAFAEDAGDAIKEVQIDAGDGCVGPSKDTIADGSYPLSRSLYIYPNLGTAGEDATLEAFVDFYLSDAGLTDAVEEANYVTLPPDRQEATRSAWRSAIS